MHDVSDCVRTFRGQVVLAIPGPSSRDRIQIVDRWGRKLSAPAGEVEAYEGPRAVLDHRQVEAHRIAVEGLAHG